MFHICLIFLISYGWFKTRSKRRSWPFLARSGILEKSQCISDEITYCVPKNDFCKKSWANYEALVVEIRHGSSYIGINLSFCRELAREHLDATSWRNILQIWSNILQNWCGTILKHILGRCFTKSTFLTLIKLTMVFLCNKVQNFLRQYFFPCKTYMCAKYRHIIRNYSMDLAVT